MNNGPDNVNNVPVADDRFAGQLGYRGVGARREIPNDPGTDLNGRNGSVLDGPVPGMSLRDLDTLAEPVYPPAGWLDGSGALADHPLLRGLLLELPPKGAMPPAEWLDRWFEAARSILELLYVQHGPHGTPRR